MVEVTGGHLAFHRTGGAGPEVVLSHGLTDNGLCWSRFAAALAPDFDVIMMDARGHGESSRMPAGGGHDPARDICEAIDQLGLRSPIVIGHSVGARATADYASRWPDRVAKVVLEDPPFLPPFPQSKSEARRDGFRKQVCRLQSMSDDEIVKTGRSTSPDWHEDEFPAWVRAKRQVDPEALHLYAAPWQETVSGIKAPTLLIHGETERGSLVTPAIIEDVRQAIPSVRTVQIDGAGHNVRRESFAAYSRVVREFLLDH